MIDIARMNTAVNRRENSDVAKNKAAASIMAMATTSSIQNLFHLRPMVYNGTAAAV
ncbi:hypothetical protein [Paramagnetospirillum magneticum]|uniref:hypothetical protein n=1 Tax=Paramagnetospirillum magneticum TaxID=84159 RepID=UPI00130518C5|nr:hypothetical protein [Paramagnetospirillum magneticum]